MNRNTRTFPQRRIPFLAVVLTTAAALLAPLSLTLSAADTYEVDAAHSSVVFKVKHSGVSHFFGLVSVKSGTVVFDEADPTKSSVELVIDPSTISTGNEKRDSHLKSPDFFNVKEFPEVAFKSTSLEKGEGDTYTLKGDLSLLGKTKPVSAVLTEVGEGKGMKGETRRGADAVIKFKRTDFGMDWGVDNGAVSDEVEVTVGLAAVKK